MVSVLIPVYNFDPVPLLQDLSTRLRNYGQPWEIILGNDSSDSIFMPVMEECARMPGVIVFNSDVNLGRSRMRNKLGSMALHPYLLFIDGDAGMVNDDFIDRYLKEAAAGCVICGGTSYNGEVPEDKEELLRWKYGREREARPASLRNRLPYNSFSSFSFMIPREIFLDIQFNEGIRKYGHEDTLFGIELEKNNIIIKHIDNPLLHKGLDSADIFLEKTREGLRNLLSLYESYDDKGILARRIRILRQYLKIRKAGLHPFLSLFCRAFAGSLLSNLKGPSPSLFLFDLYKLCIINKIQG
jgi:glycosyltransferase involved in cell wall biosynthesis